MTRWYIMQDGPHKGERVRGPVSNAPRHYYFDNVEKGWAEVYELKGGEYFYSARRIVDYEGVK